MNLCHVFLTQMELASSLRKIPRELNPRNKRRVKLSAPTVKPSSETILQEPIRLESISEFDRVCIVELIRSGTWTWRQAEAKAGITSPTIGKMLKEYQPDRCDVLSLAFKKSRAFKISGLMERILYSIKDADIEKCNAYQRVVMYSILYDKLRLEQGLPTSDVTVRGIVPMLEKSLTDATTLQNKIIDLIEKRKGVYTTVEEHAR